MKRSELAFGFARVPLDALAASAALLLSYRLREASIDLIPGAQFLETTVNLPAFEYYVRTFVVPGVILFLLLATILRLYSIKNTLSAWVQIGRVFVVAFLWLACVNAWYFLVLKQLFFSRALLFQSIFFLVLFSLAVRMALLLLERSLLRMGIGKILVVTIGTESPSLFAKDTLEHDRHYTYLGHLPDVWSLRRFIAMTRLDLVIQTDPNPGSEETVNLIAECRSHQIGYAFLPPVLADVPQQLSVDHLGLLPLIRFEPTPLDGWGRIWKRMFDIVVSGVLMVLLLPLFLVVALFSILLQGRPIFYRSIRMGQDGRHKIRLWKFRSMIPEAEQIKHTLTPQNHRSDGPLFKMKNDPRVTPFGGFLRRYSLDELPQLWDVFIGHLSLVGPRPHLPEEVARYTPEQRRVFTVKPGATGLAQISGRSDLKFEDEVRLDLQYIEEWSLLLDLWILWRTAFVILSRKGAD